jgi:hypothetical protein
MQQLVKPMFLVIYIIFIGDIYKIQLISKGKCVVLLSPLLRAVGQIVLY